MFQTIVKMKFIRLIYHSCINEQMPSYEVVQLDVSLLLAPACFSHPCDRLQSVSQYKCQENFVMYFMYTGIYTVKHLGDDYRSD